MPFDDNVTTECDFDELPEQVANKINEIAQQDGRNPLGEVTLTDGTECQHWRAGDYRIFGTYADDTLTIIGWGQHTGRGNKSYKVALCSGDTTKATTG